MKASRLHSRIRSVAKTVWEPSFAARFLGERSACRASSRFGVNRRSSTDEPVSEDQLEKLFRAAMAAANSGNQQPWRFIVVDDPAIRDRIGTLDIERRPYHVSPQLFVVCADIGAMKWKMHWLADCGAAIQNLLLAAHSMGLGAVWQELYPYHKRLAAVREILGIPDTVYPMAVVAVGHPAERPDPVDRYDPPRSNGTIGSHRRTARLPRPEALTSPAGRYLNNVHSPATLIHPKPAPSGPSREVAYMMRILTI